MELRLGTPADFPVVMDRVVMSFRENNPGHGRFEDLYPDSVTPPSMSQWRLASIEGDTVAGIQLVPRSLVCAAQVNVSGMGLGNVFCYPPFRGRGLMSRLLERCISDMRSEGVGVCLLGGDRTRYGTFGWEHAGCDRALTLSASVKRFDPEAPEVSAIELRTWTGDEDDLAKMLRAYRSLPYRTERTATECALVFRRPGQVLWISDREPEGFAYVSVNGNSILEYAGEPAALVRIVDYLLKSGSWHVVLPPVGGQGPLDALLLERAQYYQVRPTGMILVVSLSGVLQAYLALLTERLQGWNGELAIRATDTGETVRITGEKGQIAIEDAPEDDPALEMSRRELAQLFFGPFPPDMGDWCRHSAIRRLFPLPLHWHALAHV